MINIRSKDHLEEILTLDGCVILDFWAPWCAPCKALMPLLEDLDTHEGITVAKINQEELPALAMEYKVRSLPTLIFCKDGVIQDSHIGLITPSLLTTLAEKYRQ